MGATDADLIRRWQGGDLAAFEDLVRRWQQPVANFLFRMTGRRDLVADLCQEVFLRVYQAGPRYKETGAFPAWLYRIALNAARDAGRRARPAASPAAEPADPAGAADAECQRRELADRVAGAVAELPEPLRLVLVLHHYEGMNFEAISRLTGTPASTLKSRFAAALVRLRDRLRQLGYGPEEGDA
jgi:RNA polymerase sigma-70 factor (ECF subfamily)